MKMIEARNVNDAFLMGIDLIRGHGVERQSRNGPVYVVPGPVVTTYHHPCERILWHHDRDANPFFHLVEAFWMLAGARDVSTPATYVQRMRTYTDPEAPGVLRGAYGHRWRRHFRVDQLLVVAARLSHDGTDRRCVIGMWDPDADLNVVSKDVPCNTHAYVSVSHEHRLDMTVCCRSNDAIWGAHGANAVHFSLLQEVLAALVGIPVGEMVQFSNNYHAYVETFEPLRDLELTPGATYEYTAIPVVNLRTDAETLLHELITYFALPREVRCKEDGGWTARPIRRLLAPVERVHLYYQSSGRPRDYRGAMQLATEELQYHYPDWHAAITDWLVRREDRSGE